MRIADQMAVIQAGEEAPATTARLLQRRRAEAWRDLLAAADERTFAIGAISVTISSADLIEGPHPLIGEGCAIVIAMECKIADRTLRKANEPWVIINPPFMVPAETLVDGKPGFRDDVKEAFRTALTDFLCERYDG